MISHRKPLFHYYRFTFFVFNVILISLLFLFHFNNAENNQNSELNQQNSYAVQEFASGFFFAIANRDGDPTRCIRDSGITLRDWERGYRDLEYGLRHVDAGEVRRGLKRLGSGVAAMTTAMRDCGLSEVAEDVIHVAETIESNPLSVFKIVVDEYIKIWHHDHELSEHFRDAVKDFNAQEYFMSGYNAGLITVMLI
eukprot:gb/GECH01009393.1/.p1 GENE.gb/GECH01009393.1/~~gb/GECH01009393.1/.p1  ORF type:complete len:196 (+),score=45.17 gb/GECH01009393.1/:1-588(+)